MQYQETLDWLFGLENMGIKLGLSRVTMLLHELGDPQDRFRSVHVAGTNGKGSVCAMTASIMRASDIRVGLYTSPHLVDFRERIMVNGVMVSEEEVVDLANEVREAAERIQDGSSRPLTFFEITTAMAFLHFVREGVQVAVVEVGMGGRLDATNVVRPGATVITRISLEHVQYLGDTVSKIAYEKAGIIKPGTPVITAETDEDVLKVLNAAARDRGAPLRRPGTDYSFSLVRSGRDGVTVHLDSINREVSIPLLGAYQAANAAMACEAALEMRKYGLSIDADGIAAGLARVNWPGRLEVMSPDPLVVFDVSHTPEGARVAVDELVHIRQGRTTVILGVLSDKDLQGICGEFARIADRAIAVRPVTKRAFPAETVAKALSGRVPEVRMVQSVGDAIALALSEAGPGETLVVAGSLYTVGEAKAWWESHGQH